MQIWEGVRDPIKSSEVSSLSADFYSWDLNPELAWQPVTLSCRREMGKKATAFRLTRPRVYLCYHQCNSHIYLHLPHPLPQYGSHSWLLLSHKATSDDCLKLEQIFCVVP